MPKVSIIVVSVNDLPNLRVLLSQIYDPQYLNIDFETVIVDNCSQDGTQEFVCSNYPQAQLIRNQERKGFAANNNLAIRETNGDYLFLINPDTRLFPGSIETLLNFMEANPTVGIAGPLLLNSDATVQFSARKFITLRTLLMRTIYWGSDTKKNQVLTDYLMVHLDRQRAQSVDWVTGAAMMVRQAALTEVGLLDEGFFLYVEDQDWCYRMWQKGWEVYYVPHAKMVHFHQRASVRSGFSMRTIHHARSVVYFLWKHPSLLVPKLIRRGSGHRHPRRLNKDSENRQCP